MQGTGIDGPDQVEEGSTSPIKIDCPGVDEIVVYLPSTGEEFEVDAKNGSATFELPAGLTAGSTIEVADKSNPNRSHTIFVTTPTSPP